jgi:hypothetical protein
MRRLFLSTLMLLGAAAGAGVSPALAQDKLSVRLDFSPWGVQAAMHLAQNRGWFKEAKLDVDIQDGRGSGNTIQLVNAGQVGCRSGSSRVRWLSASQGRDYPFDRDVSAQDRSLHSGRQDVADAEGRRFAR